MESFIIIFLTNSVIYYYNYYFTKKMVLKTTWSTKAISKVNWEVVKKGAAKIGKGTEAASVGNQHGELYGPGGKHRKTGWCSYLKINRAIQEPSGVILDTVDALNRGFKWRPAKACASEIGDAFAEATLGEGGEETGPAEEAAAEGDQRGFKSE